MKLTILGSGTSTGVPRIGNDWGDCDPEEPRNRRSRVSVAIETDDGQRILIDTSPDLRQQLLANDIDRIDAVFWTHDHADHCHGIDDMRVLRYGRGGPIPGFASEVTVQRLRRRFDYVFAGQFGYPTIVNLEPLDRLRMICGLSVAWCEMPHGPVKSTAFRFDSFDKSVVYATDFSEITTDMISLMDGCDLLVVDCLRREPHPTHAHLGMALELAERIKAGKVVLTHLDKSMDYRTLGEDLPRNVEVGYDGMQIRP